MMRAVLQSMLCAAAVSSCVSGGSPVDDLLLSLRDPGEAARVPHEISRELSAEDIEGPALELAASHPDFEPGDPARAVLVRTLMMVRDKGGGGIWGKRSPRGDFVMSELRTGAAPVRLVAVHGSTKPGPYQAEACQFLADYVSHPAGVDDVSMLRQSLLAIAEGCGERPELIEPLRMLILDPVRGVDPAVVRRDHAGNRAVAMIPSTAAQALLATTPDVAGTVVWLRSLKDPEHAIAAREALGIVAAMEGTRFEFLDVEDQRRWVETLLEIVRATINVRGVWGEDVPRLIIVGERFPHVREAVGAFLIELLAAGARSERDAEGVRLVLRRWSMRP
jgi:hypothetical protein